MSNIFMPEDKAIKFHLSLFNMPNPTMTIFSGFIAGLRDARKFTGRQQDNGQKINEQNCGDLGSWLGAIGYMSLLDQIGTCFKPKTIPQVAGNTITKALKYFTKLSDRKIDAIYALRCAFAHDFSLYNINKKSPSLTHHFTVCQSPTFPLVTLPQAQWDGNYNNKTLNNRTIINLEAIGDTLEQIYIHLFDLANKNSLEVTLDGGSDELVQRYSFYSSKQMTI